MVFFFAIPRMTTSNRYDPVGNVTQVTSSCPWLNSQSLTETFTYDASDQLVSASETQAQSYQLAVTYGNWGKISGYSLAQTDMQSNITQSEAQAYTYPATNSIGNSQTLFAPELRTITDINNNVTTENLTFGINGSLRKREVQGVVPHTEHYLFNSQANLIAYSNNLTEFSYYGYNAANTRTYKLSMLNTNQWFNGQPFPLHFLCWLKENEAKERAFCGGEKNPVHHARQLAERRNPLRSHRSAPLSCYGKRIFSVTPQVGEMTYSNREIQRIQLWQDATVSSEVPPCNLLFSFLCFVSFIFSGRRKKERNEGKNFYYHTNHLGSTAFVTDQNQNITQGFLYAPFGEITTEYNSNFGNDIIPKYAFNAKELDEETGMYYYEARYYKPPVFTSRDPMFEKYFWMTPYAYCANNPVKYVDPDGRIIRDKNGNIVYSTSGETRTFYYSSGKSATLELGNVFANDGTPIQVFKNTTNADAGWTTNCHGTTFTDGLYWLFNDQVPALIKGDGYEVQTIENAKKGDVIIYHGESQCGEADHSVTITKTNGTLEGTEVYGQGGLEIENHTYPALKGWDNPTNNTIIRKTVPDRVVDEEEKMKLIEGLNQ